MKLLFRYFTGYFTDNTLFLLVIQKGEVSEVTFLIRTENIEFL